MRRLGTGHQLDGCSLRLEPLGVALGSGLSATLEILSRMLEPLSEEQALFQNTCLHVRGPELHRRAVVRARHRARAECEVEFLVDELHLGRVRFGSMSSMCELS